MIDSPRYLSLLPARLMYEGGRDYVHSTRLLEEYLRLIRASLSDDLPKSIMLEQLTVSREITAGGHLYLCDGQEVESHLRSASSSEGRFNVDGKQYLAFFVESGDPIGTGEGGWETRLIKDFEITGALSGRGAVHNISGAADVLRAVVEIHKRAIVTSVKEDEPERPSPSVRFVYVKNIDLSMPDCVQSGIFTIDVDTVSSREMEGRIYTSAKVRMPPELQKVMGNICFYFEHV